VVNEVPNYLVARTLENVAVWSDNLRGEPGYKSGGVDEIEELLTDLAGQSKFDQQTILYLRSEFRSIGIFSLMDLANFCRKLVQSF